METASRYRSSNDEAALSPHDRFVEQFEWDGAGYLYRYNRTGPLYRLTEADKDALIAAFDRRDRWVRRIVFLIAVGWYFVLWKAPPFRDMRSSDWSTWACGSNIVFLFGIFPLVDRSLVLRVTSGMLAHRTPVAPAMSMAERQRFRLERIPSANLIGAALIGTGVMAVVAIVGGPVNWFGWLLTLGCAGLLLWAAVQGTRKYLLARADHVANNLI